MPVVFSKAADDKLLQIYHYIAIENHAPENAEKLMTAIREEVEILADMPRIGRILLDDLTRFIVVKNHVLVYEIHPDKILITQLFGAGENWR